MRVHLAIVKFWLRCFWQALRAWCGDSEYERYLRCVTKSGAPPLTRTEFYVDQLNRRYSRPNRCC
jgi:uncharacterized short protein YbdD (DUF466 family)